MSLTPRTKKILLRCLAILAVLAVAGGWFGWYKFFREEPEPQWASEAERFKYGSIGAEAARGLPYYIWLVLPRVFPEYVPGPGGYKAFGLVWEEGKEMPVGFTKRVAGRSGGRHLLSQTFAERLAASQAPNAGRVAALSLKARSAIGLAGKTGDAVVWFDGAGSERHACDWDAIMAVVERHQPQAMVFNMGRQRGRVGGGPLLVHRRRGRDVHPGRHAAPGPGCCLLSAAGM